MYKVILSLFLCLLISNDLIIPVKNYEVKEGDWLSSIAKEHNMGWETLYSINKASLGNDPNLIHSEEVIKVPLDAYITNPPTDYPDYTIQFWVFIFLFSIFVWVIYKKKLSVNTQSSSQPIEVNVSGAGAGNQGQSHTAGSSSVLKEVPIEDINVVNFDSDKIKSSKVKTEKVKTKQDPNELAKKLKKLKK